MSLCCSELREIGVVKARTRPQDAFAFKSGQPLLDVSGVLGTSLLTVVHHVDSRGLLPGHHLGNSLANSGGKCAVVKLAPFFPLSQQYLQA